MAEQVPPQSIFQEPTFSISFLKLFLNPPVVHIPVSDQIRECWSWKLGGLSNAAAERELLHTKDFVINKISSVCPVSHCCQADPHRMLPQLVRDIPNIYFLALSIPPFVSILLLCSRCLNPSPLWAFPPYIKGACRGRWGCCFR